MDNGFIVVSTSRSAILDLQSDFLTVVVDSEFFCFESFFASLSVVGLLIEVLGRSSAPSGKKVAEFGYNRDGTCFFGFLAKMPTLLARRHLDFFLRKSAELF